MMKISQQFALRTIGDIYIVVRTNQSTEDSRQIMTLNETGAFLWNCLAAGNTRQGLLAAITTLYEVPEEDAAADIDSFLERLRTVGALLED